LVNRLEVKFFYLRTYTNSGEIHNKGGMTIAWQIQEDNSIKVSKAICSLEDNFCKAEGRYIANDRLVTGDFETISNATFLEYVSNIKFPYVSKTYSKNLVSSLVIHDMSLSFVQNVIISECVNKFT
jgi:hypothetical protein